MLRLVVLVCWIVLAPLTSMPAFAQLDFLNSDTGSKYGLDLVAPGDLLGIVVDENDRGVAGASVYMRRYAEWNLRHNNGSLKETATDSRGQFVFPSLPAGKYQLAAVKEGRATRTEFRRWHNVKDFEVAFNREPVVMRLKPAAMGQARLRVVDAATSEPVPNATVETDWSMDLKRFWKTDGAGEVLMQGLLPDSYEFKAYAPGYAKTADEGFDLKNAANVEFTFRLKPAAVVTGVVRNTQGDAVPQARLTIRDPENSSYYIASAKCDASGAYRVEHLPAAKVLLFDFSGEGHYQNRVTSEPLREKEVTKIDATLKKLPYGGSVKGVVVDADGEPIAGVEVFQWGRSSNEKRVTRTDAEGRFLLDDLYVRRRQQELCVRAGGFASVMSPVTPGPRENPAEVRIQLKPADKISGRVVDESGKPVSGARVQFGEVYFGVGEEKSTGADGRFEFDSLPENVSLEIYAKGFSQRHVSGFEVNGEGVVDFVLQPVGVVRGLVVDADTKTPLTKFNVRLGFTPDRKPGDPSHGIGSHFNGENHVSMEGRFDIEGYAVGHPFLVRVAAEGYRPVTVRRQEAVRAEDENRQTFELTSIDAATLRTIAGVIVDGDGNPVAGAQARLLASTDGTDSYGRPFQWYTIRGHGAGNTDDKLQQSMLATTDDTGRFRFEGVYDNLKLELAFWGAGVSPQRKQGIEQLSLEEQADLRIETTAAATLSLSLDEEAFATADSIYLQPLQGDRSNNPDLNTHRSDGNGRWVVSNIPPGQYRLMIRKHERVDQNSRAYQSVSIHEQRVTLAAGEKKELDLKEARLPSAQSRVLQRLTSGLSLFDKAVSEAAARSKSDAAAASPSESGAKKPTATEKP